MQCNYNSFIQIINFHGLFCNALRCRKTGACRILVPLRYFTISKQSLKKHHITGTALDFNKLLWEIHPIYECEKHIMISEAAYMIQILKFIFS